LDKEIEKDFKNRNTKVNITRHKNNSKNNTTIAQCLFFCDLVYMLLNDKTFIAALFTMDAIHGQDRLIIG
jgi:acyl-ACP thioesterase